MSHFSTPASSRGSDWNGVRRMCRLMVSAPNGRKTKHVSDESIQCNAMHTVFHTESPSFEQRQQANAQTDRQTDRLTDRQTDRHTDR